jgi:hypothetical protein
MNILIYIVLLLFFVVLQSSVLNMFFSVYLVPDLVSIFVVYLSMNRRYRESILGIFLSSYLLSLYSSGSFYIIAASFLITFGVSRYLTINFYTGKSYYMVLGVFISVFSGKVFKLMLTDLSGFLLLAEQVLYLLIQSVLTAVLSLLFFKFFRFIDIKTGLIEKGTVEVK